MENEIKDLVAHEIGELNPPMDNIICWNIWGLNGQNKQEDLKIKHSIGLAGFLETTVKAKNTNKVATSLCQGWEG